MFKQIKSALFWYYLYRFRKKVLIIAFLLLTALFANFIYADVIEYLSLKNRLEYLEIALLSKWIIIVFNILFSIYLILGMFKSKEGQKKQREELKEKEEITSSLKEELSSREKEFLYKDLNSKADKLVKR